MPGAETRKGLGLGYGPLRFLSTPQEERIGEEHLAMTGLLRASGADVVTVEGALNSAIRAARDAKALRPWLESWNPRLAQSADRIDAAALLGAADEFLYRRNDEGEFSPATDPAASFYWTRDSAVMTPRGVILCRFSNDARALETTLSRFLYGWAPELTKYPIVFDAPAEEVALEGGDTMVVDERTVFLGAGNRSDERAAPRLARRLGMDVLAVRLPTRGRGPLNGLFLHLDTVCCFADAKTVVTLPWLFEKEFAGKDPLSFMLQGLAHKSAARDQNLEQHLPELARLGHVTRYQAGTGAKDPSLGDIKLVDYLRAQGIRVLFVGGTPPETGREKHLAENVLREFRRQAANVVAVAPGKVLAYAGNPLTQKTLQEAGIEVLTFPGQEIMRHNGGPHCLTQPLERG